MSDAGERAGPAGDASTRERLLNAAYQIAAHKGEQAVTYRSVAGLAGVTHGLVRHYFGTREALIDEVMRKAASLDSTEVGLDSTTIGEFVSNFVDVVESAPERQLLQFDFVISVIRGQVARERATSLYDGYISQVRRTLSNLGVDDPEDVWAQLVFSMLDGLILQHQVYRDPARTEQILGRLRALMEDLPRKGPTVSLREPD